VNVNVDKKSRNSKLEDFYMYQPIEDKNVAASRYSDAAVQLINDGLFPSWALFCYKDLVSNATGYAPDLLAFICGDAMLLAPEITSTGYKGLLIAMESAGEKIRQMVSPCGKTFTTKIPKIPTKIIAEDNISLEHYA
jgi:hypothetical protein